MYEIPSLCGKNTENLQKFEMRWCFINVFKMCEVTISRECTKQQRQMYAAQQLWGLDLRIRKKKFPETVKFRQGLVYVDMSFRRHLRTGNCVFVDILCRESVFHCTVGNHKLITVLNIFAAARDTRRYPRNIAFCFWWMSDFLPTFALFFHNFFMSIYKNSDRLRQICGDLGFLSRLCGCLKFWRS